MLPPSRKGYRFNTQPPEGGCPPAKTQWPAWCWFQHTATRRWLLLKPGGVLIFKWFQHTATRRWLRSVSLKADKQYIVSTHSHPKVAADSGGLSGGAAAVSTHSHPKVAASGEFSSSNCWRSFQHTATRRWLPSSCDGYLLKAWFQHTATRRWLLGTRPQEVQRIVFQHTATRRWLRRRVPSWLRCSRFNTQPPEGGCADRFDMPTDDPVSTHSHPKVAALALHHRIHKAIVSTHSHPKVAADAANFAAARAAGFNTQPPEGGCRRWPVCSKAPPMFQHTATRRWLLLFLKVFYGFGWFQHTATRRWLPPLAGGDVLFRGFQHTATRRWLRLRRFLHLFHPRFNTQPPEGGCFRRAAPDYLPPRFNTQPPEGGCSFSRCESQSGHSFNTQPPEGGCACSAANSRLSWSFQHTATRRWLRVT